MARWFLFAAVVAGLFWVADSADAHGAHHSYVAPAYDCYEGIEGDVSVTYDWDKKQYAYFRCHCVITEMGYKVCYWRLIRVRANLASIHVPSNTANYYQARIVTRRVKWLAWHGTNGCVQHYARKPVIYVRRR